MKSPRLVFSLVASSVLASLGASAQEVNLVTWGDSSGYVAGKSINGSGLTAGAVPFSLTAARSPKNKDGYTGASAVFYGGAVASVPKAIDLWRVDDNSTHGEGRDAFNMRLGKTATAEDSSATAVLIWKKEDFLQGKSAGESVTLRTLSFTGKVGGKDARGEARFVIMQGPASMISEPLPYTNRRATQTRSDLSSLSWFAYDPAASLTSVGAEIKAPSFANVTAVGLSLKVYRARDFAEGYGVNAVFDTFTAKGSVTTAGQ